MLKRETVVNYGLLAGESIKYTEDNYGNDTVCGTDRIGRTPIPMSFPPRRTSRRNVSVPIQPRCRNAGFVYFEGKRDAVPCHAAPRG